MMTKPGEHLQSKGSHLETQLSSQRERENAVSLSIKRGNHNQQTGMSRSLVSKRTSEMLLYGKYSADKALISDIPVRLNNRLDSMRSVRSSRHVLSVFSITAFEVNHTDDKKQYKLLSSCDQEQALEGPEGLAVPTFA